ncbi:MAG: S8 family serine peptidase [Candidatus Dadabacteria bacterium]
MMGAVIFIAPAAADNIIAVSATDNNDNLAGFSSFGNFVDLAAPGVSIANVRSSLAIPCPICFLVGNVFLLPNSCRFSRISLVC